MVIRSDRPVVSLISDQWHYTYLYGHTKHNREVGRKDQTRTWVSSKRKRGEFVTLSLCICRLSRVCILRETSTKPQGVMTHLLTAQLPSFHCLLLLTVSFSGQLFQADCSLLPSFVNCSLCLLWDLPPFLHFRSRRRYRPQALCVDFAPKQTKRSSEWRQHKRKRMPRIVSHFFQGLTPVRKKKIWFLISHIKTRSHKCYKRMLKLSLNCWNMNSSRE